MKVLLNHPISSITTFKNLGTISKLCLIESFEDIAYFPYYPTFSILGGGSNTLIDPKLSRPIMKISCDIIKPSSNNGILTVSAGTSVAHLMRLCIKNKLGNIGFIAGVPANVGGLITMNFGCWNHCFSNYIHRVFAFNWEKKKFIWLSRSEIDWGYRYSSFQTHPLIIILAELTLQPHDPKELLRSIQVFLKKRHESQPLQYQTFGSIFKNPNGFYAGKLIEKLGYKGKSYDKVAVSSKHANFLVNKGGANFNQTINLINKIHHHVLSAYNIDMDLEVKIVSNFTSTPWKKDSL